MNDRPYSAYNINTNQEKTMPLARISLPAGRSPEYKKALADGVLRALVDTFNVPPDDQFIVLTEHSAEDLI